MTHQALYRVWRPQSFADVSGQHVVTKTLKNAIKNDNTSHAYLFTGPRGTGKTSVAKIFAKAINCPYSDDGEPCNECQICQEITQGSLGDVIEIDAASNNGVEEIRDIREKANYAPTSAVYKVYIIDEVHMLSSGAFNALLKTLEEPPANVVFILATTEPHKIPATIISRTQRFDFKRIDNQDIIDRLIYILEEDQVPYSKEAVLSLANAAEGGMRDALSMLDQALSFMTDELTEEVALQITGSITQSLLLEYLQVISQGQTEEGLKLLQEVLGEGKDPSRFVEDAIMMTRDLLLYQTSQGDNFVPKLARLDDQFKDLARDLDKEMAYHIIDVLNQTQDDLRLSNHGEVYLEIATVKLSQPSSAVQTIQASQVNMLDQDNKEEIAQLQNQVKSLQQSIQNLQAGAKQGPKQRAKSKAGPNQSGPGKSRTHRHQQGFKVNRKAVYSILDQATRKDLDDLQDLWPDLINVLTISQKAILNNSKPVAASPEGLVVTFEYDILCERAESDETLQTAIGNYIEKIIGRRPRLVCVPEDKWPTIRRDFIKQMKKEDGSAKDGQASGDDQDDDPGQEDNQALNKAVELFGKDNITIKD